MQKVTQETFLDALKSVDEPYLLFFSASWCGPCRSLTPIMDEVSVKRFDEIDILGVDIDESPNLVKKFNIVVVPTVISVFQGKETGRFSGAKSSEFINDFIDTALKDRNV